VPVSNDRHSNHLARTINISSTLNLFALRPRLKPTLTHTDDLIQALTYLCKQAIGQRPDWVWLGPA
jgi:hypothetical protein